MTLVHKNGDTCNLACDQYFFSWKLAPLFSTQTELSIHTTCKNSILWKIRVPPFLIAGHISNLKIKDENNGGHRAKRVWENTAVIFHYTLESSIFYTYYLLSVVGPFQRWSSHTAWPTWLSSSSSPLWFASGPPCVGPSAQQTSPAPRVPCTVCAGS